MDKKNSLGSTPIGYNIDRTNYSFIRDIGVSETEARSKGNGEEAELKDKATGQSVSDATTKNKATNQGPQPEHIEKKIVSYYIEVGLIDRLKEMAEATNNYYSAVASRAIEAWIEHHGF